MAPPTLDLGEVQRVLHALLEEGVSIRDLVRIFEALSVRAKTSTDLDGLVEAARTALGSQASNELRIAHSHSCATDHLVNLIDAFFVDGKICILMEVRAVVESGIHCSQRADHAPHQV